VRNLNLVGSRQDHDAKAQVLRAVIEAFPPAQDTSADRAIRQRLEGAVIASEVAAGERVSLPPARRPEPPKATSEPHRGRSARQRRSSHGQ